MGEWRRINWNKQPLGIVPDAVLAKKLGVGRVRVMKARNDRKIPAAPSVRKHIRKGIDWGAEPLGTVPDRILAEKHGVTTSVVAMARKRRGVAAHQPQRAPKRTPKGDPFKWDEQPLGEISDKKIAEDLGTTTGTVRRARVSRGIPVCEASRRYVHKGINWDEQPLGEMSDGDLARQCGVTPETVLSARRRRGVAPFTKSGGKIDVDWDEQPLGKEPDKLIALMLGCSVSTVAKARAAREIAPYRKKSGAWLNN